ncbi:MAG: methionyl-tRNA formyltransferase [Patescibacteria group bacterium]
MNKNIKVGFFGTPEYAVIVLEKLKTAGFDVAFVLTNPDRPQGRKMLVTPPPAKVWAESNGVAVLQPETLKSAELEETLKAFGCDVFVVMAYGKIIPESILNIPKGKTLNIHPSLLPKFRGPSPIESAILADEKNTGVTIMRLDREMDHGPIIAQKEATIETWPPKAHELGTLLVTEGADLLISILPDWMDGKIQEKEQDHSQATFCKMIKKEDGLIDLSDDAYKNFLKIRAYDGWPSAYFMKDGKRVKVVEASHTDGVLTLLEVVPEGRNKMLYQDFLR